MDGMGPARHPDYLYQLRKQRNFRKKGEREEKNQDGFSEGESS